MFGKMLSNSIVTIYCDNIAVCEIVNKLKCKNKYIAEFLRHLVLKLIEYNIDIRAKHIPGKNNILCDKISRFQADAQLLKEHNMEREKTQIPTRLLPENWKFHHGKM